MTSLADRAILALRAHHDTLAAFVATASDEQLAAQSGASEWSVADVLSHLGSGAEIMRFPLLAAVDGAAPPEGGMQPIWDRWNALSPREQATGYVEHDARYVETVEALDAAQRADLLIDLGFLPEPVPLEVALGMRLDEVALHAWDVAVAEDASAPLREESAEVLLDLIGGPMGFLLGFLGKADQLEQPVELQVGSRGLSIGEAIALGGRSGRAHRDLVRTRRGAGAPGRRAARRGVHARDGGGRGQRHARRPAPGVPGFLTRRGGDVGRGQAARQTGPVMAPAARVRLTRPVRSTSGSPSAPPTAPRISELGSFSPRSTSERYWIETPERPATSARVRPCP